ncbi:hypothetical protein, partial [Ancylobacter oerskovii]
MNPNVRHIENISELRASHLPNIGDLIAVTRADGVRFIIEACSEQEGRYYRVYPATDVQACWGDCIGWATETFTSRGSRSHPVSGAEKRVPTEGTDN